MFKTFSTKQNVQRFAVKRRPSASRRWRIYRLKRAGRTRSDSLARRVAGERRDLVESNNTLHHTWFKITEHLTFPQNNTDLLVVKYSAHGTTSDVQSLLIK